MVQVLTEGFCLYLPKIYLTILKSQVLRMMQPLQQSPGILSSNTYSKQGKLQDEGSNTILYLGEPQLFLRTEVPQLLRTPVVFHMIPPSCYVTKINCVSFSRIGDQISLPLHHACQTTTSS